MKTSLPPITAAQMRHFRRTVRHRVGKFLFPSLPRHERRHRLRLLILTALVGLGAAAALAYSLWKS